MATFTIEAESFDLLRASQAQAISLPSDSPTDTFTDYEEESRSVQMNPVTLVRMPADPGSAPGDKARITTVFDRGSGIYTVKVNYVDERNGVATGELVIGDNTPLTWTFDGNQGPVPGTPYVIARSVSSSNLSILAGDHIILTGQRQANEAARIDSVEFTEVVTGELEFSATAIRSGEGDGSVEITVTRSNANVGDARATVLIDGKADGGSDYTLNTGVSLITSEVFFAEGDVEETITITLLDDLDVEGEETLTLTLEAIAGESLIGAQDTFTLTIEDNDQPPAPPTPSPTPTPDTTGGDNSPTPSPTPTPDTTGGDNSPTPSPTPTPDTTGGDNSPMPDTTDDIPPSIVAGEEIEGTGRDQIKGATRWADFLNGSDVADVIDALSGDDFVWTGMEDDTVFGRRGRDFVNVGAGNDWVRGGKHRDVIKAGVGNDFVNGCRGGDTINGGAGNDTLIGLRGQDIIFGGAGDDILKGGRARDQLNGDAGDDILAGGSGSDTLSGGAGNDIFVLSQKIGSDTITDFEVKGDRLQFPDKLTFADLDIHSAGGDTIISTLAGQSLATLLDVDASLVTEGVFV